MTRATLILHDELEVFLSLRELFSRNRVAESFSAETLTELLYRERLLDYQPSAAVVEVALEALKLDEELLA